MRFNQYNSDYGSGSSTDSMPPARETLQSSSWQCLDGWQTQPRVKPELSGTSFSSFDLMMRKRGREDVMTEFRMNGFDSPYNPDEDKRGTRQPEALAGMGPAGAFLRQMSCPEPERPPAQRLPRPRSLHDPRWTQDFYTSTPVFEESAAPQPNGADAPPAAAPGRAGALSAELLASLPAELSAEQGRVLLSLPNSVLYSLLRGLRHERRARQLQECRFCKNNGERESFYRSHALKDGAGRVACPVLRAFVCRRCGARGDAAHTIKYCPLSTSEERIKSSAMMRSVRMASGRRRHSLAPSVASAADYVVFGEPSPSVVQDNNVFIDEAPLDPLWAALEQKLSL